jgi:hypothetical protein
VHASTGWGAQVFAVAPCGHPPGTYTVRRHDVRRWCAFDFLQGDEAPEVWGVGYDSWGYTAEHPNYAMWWRHPIGTPTLSGCEAQTYVFEVRTLEGEELGWWRPPETSASGSL